MKAKLKEANDRIMRQFNETYAQLSAFKELEIEEKDQMLAMKEIKEVYRGSENIYFEGRGGKRFFCKCL